MQKANTRMPILVKNQTSDQLYASLAHAGVSPHLARRLLAAAVKRGVLYQLRK